MRAQIMHVTQACHTTEHAQLSIQLSFFLPQGKNFTFAVSCSFWVGNENSSVNREGSLIVLVTPTLKLALTLDVCMHDSNSLSNECHSMASPLVSWNRYSSKGTGEKRLKNFP